LQRCCHFALIILGRRKGSSQMLDGQISRYEKRILEEEKLAREARSAESAIAHQQAVMLYKSELAIVRRKLAPAVRET
jgi:hypothetical protein